MNRTISACELKELLEKPGGPQLVDLRTPSEYASGHVPRAINLPMEQIEGRLRDLIPDSPIVLICQSGRRAQLTAALLEPCRADAIILDGGTNAWISAGFPTVMNAKTRWALERQVRVVAGLLALAAAALALTVSLRWAYLAGLVGLGLTFAGFTDICPMASLLCRMPWNRAPRRMPPATAGHGQSCSLKNVSPAGHRGETILS